MANNKHYQKSKRSNPALIKMNVQETIKKSMDEARNQGINYAILAYNIILANVLSDKTDLNDEQVQRVIDQIAYLAESITENYVTIPELVNILKEEYNLKLDDEKILKYYPELEGYLEPDNK